jgi:methyl coenzyme M reductase alpha subunit
MNMFFRAFTQQELDKMDADHLLIDKWIWEDETYSVATDVETAWDVLNTILGGVGFPDYPYIDDVLSNGCVLMSAEIVKDHAQKLSNWTREQVLEGLRNLDAESDLYRLELFQEDEGYLLEQFDRLVAFYQEAAEKGWGAVSYPA